jgi:hypothetical protein
VVDPSRIFPGPKVLDLISSGVIGLAPLPGNGKLPGVFGGPKVLPPPRPGGGFKSPGLILLPNLLELAGFGACVIAGNRRAGLAVPVERVVLPPLEPEK